MTLSNKTFLYNFDLKTFLIKWLETTNTILNYTPPYFIEFHCPLFAFFFINFLFKHNTSFHTQDCRTSVQNKNTCFESRNAAPFVRNDDSVCRPRSKSEVRSDDSGLFLCTAVYNWRTFRRPNYWMINNK